MKNLFDARLSFYSIGLIISSTIERLITAAINSYVNLASVYYHMISLSILIVLFILTNYFLKPFTQKEFITEIILGKKYIGGRWVEISITEDDEISHITKVDITYDNDKLIIHGDCYHYADLKQRGQKKHSFDSVCASLDKYDLTYVFIAREELSWNREENQVREGIGHLTFDHTRTKKLDKYNGGYKDNGKGFKIAGILEIDKLIVKQMDDDFIDTVEHIVLPKLKKIHKLNVSLSITKNSNDVNDTHFAIDN